LFAAILTAQQVLLVSRFIQGFQLVGSDQTAVRLRR
jgi:hypothetical protein